MSGNVLVETLVRDLQSGDEFMLPEVGWLVRCESLRANRFAPEEIVVNWSYMKYAVHGEEALLGRKVDMRYYGTDRFLGSDVVGVERMS
jgi:hypothetical protein